jgi:hypothetical protein
MFEVFSVEKYQLRRFGSSKDEARRKRSMNDRLKQGAVAFYRKLELPHI